MNVGDVRHSTEWKPISLEAPELAEKAQDKKKFKVTAYLPSFFMKIE